MPILTTDLSDPADIERSLEVLHKLRGPEPPATNRVKAVLAAATDTAAQFAEEVALMLRAGEEPRGKVIRDRHKVNQGTLGAWVRSLNVAAKSLGVPPLLDPTYPDGDLVVYRMDPAVVEAVLAGK